MNNIHKNNRVLFLDYYTGLIILGQAYTADTSERKCQRKREGDRQRIYIRKREKKRERERARAYREESAREESRRESVNQSPSFSHSSYAFSLHSPRDVSLFFK